MDEYATVTAAMSCNDSRQIETSITIEVHGVHVRGGATGMHKVAGRMAIRFHDVLIHDAVNAEVGSLVF